MINSIIRSYEIIINKFKFYMPLETFSFEVYYAVESYWKNKINVVQNIFNFGRKGNYYFKNFPWLFSDLKKLLRRIKKKFNMNKPLSNFP